MVNHGDAEAFSAGSNDIKHFVLSLAGSGSIIPNNGVVVGGKCQVAGSVPSETVSLYLKVNQLSGLQCVSFLNLPCCRGMS